MFEEYYRPEPELDWLDHEDTYYRPLPHETDLPPRDCVGRCPVCLSWLTEGERDWGTCINCETREANEGLLGNDTLAPLDEYNPAAQRSEVAQSAAPLNDLPF